MKKIIALLLAVMMVLAMAACAAKTTDTPAPAETDNKTDAVQETATEAAADGKTEVRSFTVPDQQWQDDVAAALIEYAQGTGDWSKVKSAYVDGWATEWNNNEESLGSVPQAQKFDQQG